MLPIYGPYAAALSYIIGFSSFKVDDKPFKLFRGLSLDKENLSKYKIGEEITLNGFKSASLDLESAAEFAFESADQNKLAVILVIEPKKYDNMF